MQAWASSAIFATELGIALEVAWEPERIAAAEWQELFSAEQRNSSFCSISEVNDLLGMPHDEWPRYLTSTSDRNTLVLAGHDCGEQVFVPQLLDELASSNEIHTLIIIAGGKFHTGDFPEFDRQRQDFYSHINWVARISDPVQENLEAHPPYIGLHVRGTDHARSAPTKKAMKAALLQLSRATQIKDVYIAADTRETRDWWHKSAQELQLRPWSYSTTSYERTSANAGIDAMIEWNLLRNSQGQVYSKISSYAEEASVASGYSYRSVGLSASPFRQKLRAFPLFMKSGIAYSKKRLKIL